MFLDLSLKNRTTYIDTYTYVGAHFVPAHGEYMCKLSGKENENIHTYIYIYIYTHMVRVYIYTRIG